MNEILTGVVILGLYWLITKPRRCRSRWGDTRCEGGYGHAGKHRADWNNRVVFWGGF